MRTRERLGRFVADILADADRARFWAGECGWMPGTGRCRRRQTPECENECVFRQLLDGEADQIRRDRQRRRPQPRP